MDLCYKCKNDFKEEETIGKCDSCDVQFHLKCVGAKKTEITARQNSKCLRLYCKDCFDNPFEIIRDNVSAILNYVTKFDMVLQENKLIQQKNDIFNSTITKKLQLLENEIKIINNNNKTSKSSDEAAGVKHTYASMIKSKTIKPVVVIKPKTKQESKTTLTDLTNNLNVSDYKVSNTRNIRNGAVVLSCDDVNETVKVKQAIEQKLGANYDINLPVIKKPRLRITNIDENISNDQIIDELKKRNKEIESFDIKLIAVLNKSHRGNTFNDIVVEIDGTTHCKLLSIKKLYLPWRECIVFDHLYLKRCFKCCGYSHTSIDCKKQQICSRCGSNTHNYNNCTARTNTCINCKSSNDKYKTKLNVNHHAFSEHCAITQRRKTNIKNRIEYNERI